MKVPVNLQRIYVNANKDETPEKQHDHLNNQVTGK